MYYTTTGRVTGSMCDSATKLSPLAIFQLVEDAVTDLMGDLHIDGLTAMREYGAMWVFVKNVIHVFHRPDWRSPYVLRSFISGHSAAKLMIDTEILTGADSVPAVRSRLELCALDLHTGSIRKAATVGLRSDTPCEEALPDLKFSRFPKQEARVLETVRVQATNLDYCSHTNNVEYIRFILNTYQAKELTEHEIEQIEVHYGQQTFEGNVLSIARHREENQDIFSVFSEKGLAVECAINWRQNSVNSLV